LVTGFHQTTTIKPNRMMNNENRKIHDTKIIELQVTILQISYLLCRCVRVAYVMNVSEHISLGKYIFIGKTFRHTFLWFNDSNILKRAKFLQGLMACARRQYSSLSKILLKLPFMGTEANERITEEKWLSHKNKTFIRVKNFTRVKKGRTEWKWKSTAVK